MALRRISKWTCHVKTQGVFFRIFTDAGKFDTGGVSFERGAAALAILNGPNPGYDDSDKTFFGTNSEGLFDSEMFEGNLLATTKKEKATK